MPKTIYEYDTCDAKYAARVAALECHPAVTTWYSCDDAACDYLYSEEYLAVECDHLEDENV